MKSLSKDQFLEFLEWAMVIVVAFYMIVYGASKYIQFGAFSNYTKPINSYLGMELMWAFYSYSKPYIIIIGLMEILGAILLILPKTRILGGFVLSAILINIILQDYFYGVLAGALIYAICFQIMILMVFYFHRSKVLEALKSLEMENVLFRKLKSFKNIFTLFTLIVILVLFLSFLTQLFN